MPRSQSALLTFETLRLFSIFVDVDVSLLEQLVAQMQAMAVPPRTVLLAAGQPGHAVYFLLEGSVRITLNRPNKSPKSTVKNSGTAMHPLESGDQVMLNLCGPGTVLGELSVLDGLGHSASVIAREPCRLLWIDKDIFLQAVEQTPALSLALLRECSSRLRAATHQLHSYSTLDATGRIAYALLQLAERYGTRSVEGVHLDINLTQPELADLVGLTRTRVNTVIGTFKSNGWLSQEEEGALLLRDTDNLAAAAQHIFALDRVV